MKYLRLLPFLFFACGAPVDHQHSQPPDKPEDSVTEQAMPDTIVEEISDTSENENAGVVKPGDHSSSSHGGTPEGTGKNTDIPVDQIRNTYCCSNHPRPHCGTRSDLQNLSATYGCTGFH